MQSEQKGQKSWHPLFCFITENRECLNNWFRTGCAWSANGCAEFMKECFSKIPARVGKFFVRADSAFFNGGLFDLIEENENRYLIKAGFKGIESLLEKQEWRPVRKHCGFECTEFFYKCGGWSEAGRFTAIREINVAEATDTLFPRPRD